MSKFFRVIPVKHERTPTSSAPVAPTPGRKDVDPPSTYEPPLDGARLLQPNPVNPQQLTSIELSPDFEVEDPRSFEKIHEEPAGHGLLHLGQASSDTAATMLLNAYAYTGAADGTAHHAGAAADILVPLIQQDETGIAVAVDALLALEDLQDPGLVLPLRTARDPSELPALASVSILLNLWQQTGAGPVDNASMARLTTSYLDESKRVGAAPLGDYVGLLVEDTRYPDPGLLAFDRFLNDPLETFDRQGSEVGNLSLGGFGLSNAVDLLFDLPPAAAAHTLNSAGIPHARDLFTLMADRFPTQAHAIRQAGLNEDIIAPQS